MKSARPIAAAHSLTGGGLIAAARRFTTAGLVAVACLLITCSNAVAEPFATTTARDLRDPIQTSESRILILSAGALYRFTPESETWTVTGAEGGLPSGPLRCLYRGEENLWVTGDGAAFSDLRFDDWQRYGPGEGYPGRAINAIAADEDYAYAGSDAGAARFDKYILEWEVLPGPDGAELGPINDVVADDERVWFACADGVAEFRKDSETWRVDTQLGGLLDNMDDNAGDGRDGGPLAGSGTDSREPASGGVLALRQSADQLWAISAGGVARFNKELRTWTAFLPGRELPDARVRQVELQGDDLWLGGDAGLWRYEAETGIWRHDEACEDMPGERVLAFKLESERLWAVTERAFALYERDGARWIDYGASLATLPGKVLAMDQLWDTLVFLTEDEIVYGLSQGQTEPSLFTYRSRPCRVIRQDVATGTVSAWRTVLDDGGFGLRGPGERSGLLKGGATVYLENDAAAAESGLGEMIRDTRLDVSLSGRLGNDRTLSGFYNSTNPDNHAYALNYRGARDDLLRSASLGEIDQQFFNSSLAPGTGLTGGMLRLEAGARSELTRRRLLTADAWLGRRRTLPGRDVFYGGNQDVGGSLRDVDYAHGVVFGRPAGWPAGALAEAAVYRDDASSNTDNANTIHGELAGQTGAWDLLRGERDYILGPDGETLQLLNPLGEGQELALTFAGQEEDLSDAWLRNHYRITTDPLPGSLRIVLTDSLGASTNGAGQSYLAVHGLDADGDGVLDAERFSPLTGMLDFPDELPFPSEVYGDPPLGNITISFSYQASLSTFILSRRHILPGSERVTLDRKLLKSGTDYSLIHSSGIFVFYEHVILDDDSIVEIEYQYEVDAGAASELVAAGQVGFAPGEHVFLGLNASDWTDDEGRGAGTVNFNARLEWKAEDYFLRLSPELALSRRAGLADEAAASGRALGLGLRGHYRGLELSASHRDLGADYMSFEDRCSLLGRLRRETRANALLRVGKHWQAELDLDRGISDQLSAESGFAAGDTPEDSEGEISALSAAVRMNRPDLPSIELSRGRILLDAPGRRQEKTVSRLELDYDPAIEKISAFGMQRLWLRAFVQRSEREFSGDMAAVSGEPERSTDHAYLRLNCATGSALAWNIAFEDQHSFLPSAEDQDLRRLQRFDATLQLQPHSALDAYLRWEGERDLNWQASGETVGFAVERSLLGTIQIYPGRLHDRLARLAFRVDLNNMASEDGEAGLAMPGVGSLWRTIDDASLRAKNRVNTVEARVQLHPRWRLVERLELESGHGEREGLRGDDSGWELENRIEVKPDGGTLMLRLFNSAHESDGEQGEGWRFNGTWDQILGRGFLSYVSLDTRREETRDRALGEQTRLLTPNVQLTWRHSRLRLDVRLGATLSWMQSRDISAGATGDWLGSRQQTLSFLLNINPWRIVHFKIQYSLTRSYDELAPDPIWNSFHDLRLRLQIRA